MGWVLLLGLVVGASKLIKSAAKFKILPQFLITDNMGIGSNNPLVSYLYALK